MNEIKPADVATKYNAIEVIWNESDKWHLRQKRMISDFISESLASIPNHQHLKTLNAGSAGYSYNLNEENILHIDIAQNKISHLPNSLVADIQNLPLDALQFSKPFDLIICVGSVINYCDPISVFIEFNKIISKNGYMILEFENSFTLELIGKSTFNQRAVLIDTFYNGKPEKIWFFSERYVRELAVLNGYKILAVKRAHILSPLIYRLFKKESFAASFGALDKFCSHIPLLKKFSSNTIFLFIKN
jgi:SAM-dependent methyltransferase